MPSLRSLLLAALVAWPVVAQAGHRSREQREQEAHHACAAGQVEVGIDLLAGLLTEYGHPNYIYNQARCYQQNRHPEEAISRFKEYLRVVEHPSTEERARIERFIAELEAEVAPPPAPTPAAPPVQVVAPAAPAPARRSWLLPATGMVLGAGGIAAGIFASVRVDQMNRQVERAGYGEFTNESLATHAARAHRYETLQWVGYGLGGAALATSIIALVVAPSHPVQASAVRLAGGVGPDGTPRVAVSGSF